MRHFEMYPIIIVTGLEFVENLIKLNWSKITKNTFEIKNRKIDLLIGEAKAPGKELAYLSTIENSF